MKNLSLLTWLTQLGLSVALPPAGFVMLAVWLRERFTLGSWVIWVGVVLGVVCAVNGLLASLRTMSRLAKDETENEPPIAYNDHH